MSNLGKVFGADKNLESGEGVVIDFPEGIQIKIHRAGGSNRKFETVFASKLKPHRHNYNRGMLSEEIMEKIMYETYAEAVVIDWAGITDSEGNAVPFSPEKCVEFFREYPDFYYTIKRDAENLALFRQEQEEIEEKN